jgi:predicted nucleic acid-binding protein
VTFLLDTHAVSELMRADTRIEKWMAGLNEEDRIVTCTIVRGEILFGISRLPEGKRRAELEQMGRQFLDAFHCEPVPARASDFYSAIKLARYSRGLALDENDLWIAATAFSLGATLVSRDQDFAGIEGLTVVAPG